MMIYVVLEVMELLENEGIFLDVMCIKVFLFY